MPLSIFTELYTRLARATHETAVGGVHIEDSERGIIVQVYHNIMVTIFAKKGMETLPNSEKHCIQKGRFVYADGDFLDYYSGLHQSSHANSIKSDYSLAHTHFVKAGRERLTQKEIDCVISDLFGPQHLAEFRSQCSKLDTLAQQGVSQTFLAQCQRQIVIAFGHALLSLLLYRYILPTFNFSLKWKVLKIFLTIVVPVSLMIINLYFTGTICLQQILPVLVALLLRDWLGERVTYCAILIESLSLTPDMPTIIEKGALMLVTVFAEIACMFFTSSIVNMHSKFKQESIAGRGVYSFFSPVTPDEGHLNQENIESNFNKQK